MRTTELGFLRIGDTFRHNGQKYKVMSVGDNDVDNVKCFNLSTKKHERLDVSDEVEVEE